MYAHVNIWRLNETGATSNTEAAQAIAERYRTQPGFRSYTLIRTGPQETVVVTLFDSREQLEAAVHALADVVRQRVDPLAVGAPERRQGEVLFHAEA